MGTSHATSSISSASATRVTSASSFAVPVRPCPGSCGLTRTPGEPLGVEVSSAVFDRIRTCDNHCAFCFIYQLPKGMRRSLYLKDDDYRLSFLYGNFTTLTRFTELDAERILTERLGPLFVSIHTTDPELRAHMLRNPKGATSLRWLQVLLDGGIEVHGQIVVCPGVNDGAALEDTLAGILDRYPALSSVGAVPLGLSRYSKEPEMRPHTLGEAEAGPRHHRGVATPLQEGVGSPHGLRGRRVLPVGGTRSSSGHRYDGYPQHENGIGMARAFVESFSRPASSGPGGVRHGFFASVDSAPAEGYRAPARSRGARGCRPRPITILTGTYGARVLGPLVAAIRVTTSSCGPSPTSSSGATSAVAGLLTGEDLARALAGVPDSSRCLLPDACLNEGRFLDGLSLADLPRPVEVVPTEGASLRLAIDGTSFRPVCGS